MFAVISRAAELPQIPLNLEIQTYECIVQLGQLVINLLKILYTNAAWQRRKLGKILQDWHVIYMQLEMTFQKDTGQIASIFTDKNLCKKLADRTLMWVEEQIYWIAFHFLNLGFELELYSPAEYCMVYWYMYVVLIKQAEKAHLRTSVTNDSDDCCFENRNTRISRFKALSTQSRRDSFNTLISCKRHPFLITFPTSHSRNVPPTPTYLHYPCTTTSKTPKSWRRS